MVCEITITAKNEEKNLKKKFLVYEIFQATDVDPVVKDCIDQTIKDFISEPTDIKIRINLLTG